MGHPGVLVTRARRQLSWLLLARVVWVAVLALTLGLFVAGIPVFATELRTACAGAGCYTWQVSPRLATDLGQHGFSLGFYAAYVIALECLFVLGFCAIAAVIALRRSNEPMALFAAFTLVTFGPAFSDTILALGLSAPL